MQWFLLLRQEERYGVLAVSDVSLQVKAKILAHLDNDAMLISLVSSSNIFPMQVPSDQCYPFLRYGTPTVLPYEDWCGVGSTVENTIHCFATSETEAQRIAAVVQDSLSTMENIVSYNWVRTQFRQDPDEESVWDGMVTFIVTDRS